MSGNNKYCSSREYVYNTIQHSREIAVHPDFVESVGQEIALQLQDYLDLLYVPQVRDGRIRLAKNRIERESIPIIALKDKEKVTIDFLEPTPSSMLQARKVLYEYLEDTGSKHELPGYEYFFARKVMSDAWTDEVYAIEDDFIGAVYKGSVFWGKEGQGVVADSRSMIALRQFPGEITHPSYGTLLHEIWHVIFNQSKSFRRASSKDEVDQDENAYDELIGNYVGVCAVSVSEQYDGGFRQMIDSHNQTALRVEELRAEYCDPSQPFALTPELFEQLSRAGLLARVFHSAR